MSSTPGSIPPPIRLNPDMVYRPLTPPSVALGHDDCHPIKLPLLPISREFAILLTFITSIMWITVGAGLRNNPLPIAIFVMVELLFVWNILLVRYMVGCKIRAGKVMCPSISCQIGCFQCSCGHDHDSTGHVRLENGADDDNGDEEPPCREQPAAAWLIDAALTIALFVLVLRFLNVESFYQRSTRTLPLIFSFIVMGIECLIIVFSPFKATRSAIICISSEEITVRRPSGYIKLNRHIEPHGLGSISA